MSMRFHLLLVFALLVFALLVLVLLLVFLSLHPPGSGLLRNPFCYTINAKIFQALGPKKRESCNGDRVYERQESLQNIAGVCFNIDIILKAKYGLKLTENNQTMKLRNAENCERHDSLQNSALSISASRQKSAI